MSDQEVPPILVRSQRDGYTARVPALGDDVIFGPSLSIRDVVAAARQAVFNHLRAVLPGPLHYFGPVVVARGTHLRANDLLALFEGNGVSEKVDLSDCYLPLIDLGRAALQAELARWRASGEGGEPPWRSILNEGMCLGDCVLHATYLNGANLEGADLTLSNLTDVKLINANLDRTLLWHSDLRGAFIKDTSFRGADFLGTHLERVDLYDAHLDDALWRGALLDKTRMRRDRLGRAAGEELVAKGQQKADPIRAAQTFHDAREAYLALKANFDSIGRYDDASWAYMKEQQMEKAMYFPTTVGHSWIRRCMGGAVPPAWWGPANLPRWLRWKLRSGFYHSRLFLGLSPRGETQEIVRRDAAGSERDEWLSRWRWLRNWGYELVTGYGERPWNTVATGLTMVLAFAVGFWASGIASSHNPGAFLDCLIYSFATFATFNLSRPVLNPEGRGIEAASSLEAILGIGVLALVVFTLGNRMRRS